MSLPDPISVIYDDPSGVQSRVRVIIAYITNAHLRDLVILYDAKKSQTTPLSVAQSMWGNIAFIWSEHHAEAEETIRKYVTISDIDTWLENQYKSDMAKYQNMTIPNKL